MTFFYLEHKDGGWMKENKSGKGYTWSEPQTESPPRFFSSPKGAKAAIREWAKGKQFVSVEKLSVFQLQYTKETKIIPTPDRSVTDWIIKEFNP